MIVKNIETIQEIQDAINLDKNSFTDDEVGILDTCIKWLNACQDLYTAIFNGNELVGYINFMPLKKEVFENYKQGKMIDNDLKDSDILPFHKGDNYCLLTSIVIKQSYRNTNAIKILTQALFKKINDHNKNKEIIKEIIFDCVSNDGEKYAKNFFDAILIKESLIGKIYAVNGNKYFKLKNKKEDV